MEATRMEDRWRSRTVRGLGFVTSVADGSGIWRMSAEKAGRRAARHVGRRIDRREGRGARVGVRRDTEGGAIKNNTANGGGFSAEHPSWRAAARPCIRPRRTFCVFLQLNPLRPPAFLLPLVLPEPPQLAAATAPPVSLCEPCYDFRSPSSTHSSISRFASATLSH